MANEVAEQFIIFPFEFISPLEFVVEESLAISSGVAMVRGTLLREGVSRNKNLYTIEEMGNIAKQAEGMPIYVGTMTKRDPNTGMLKKNMHANLEENRVGEIMEAVLNKAKRVIKFIAKIVNTKKYPDIVQKIKKGWGVSIGGVAHKAKLVLEESGRILRKILGLELNHVQLLPPNKLSGIEGAEVEGVEIQESMIMYCDEETGICYLGDIPVESQKEEIDKITLGRFIKGVKIS